jgi:hypothetical protein
VKCKGREFKPLSKLFYKIFGEEKKVEGERTFNLVQWDGAEPFSTPFTFTNPSPLLITLS